jgi:phosphate transport system substrate-binding protein
MKKFGIYIMLILSGILCFMPLGSGEEINLVGTENGEEVFKAVAKAFAELKPGVVVKIPESIDSGGGIKAVADDKALIARVARGFTNKEKEYGLAFVPFAKTHIVFFVHRDSGVNNLSSPQICAIYSGKIVNWKELGGKDEKIRVVTREEGDSSIEILEDNLPGFKDIKITTFSKTVLSETEAIEMVKAKPGTICFGTFGIVKNADVKIVSLEGKNPDAPDYRLTQTLGLVFKEKNKTGIIAEFIAFAVSPAAHESIKKSGGTPF